MALTKLETRLHIDGSTESFWMMLADLVSNGCYDTMADAYEAVQVLVENGEDEGTNVENEIIDITGYPVRQLPPIKKGFNE